MAISMIRVGLLSLALLGGPVLVGCRHHHRDDDDYDRRDVVIYDDQDRCYHRGYYDHDHYWHGGYDDDRHVYHADPRDYRRGPDRGGDFRGPRDRGDWDHDGRGRFDRR